MPSSHGTGTLDPDVLAVGDNQADTSGVASGLSSDEVNDRTGRPREGQISPALPRHSFPPMRIASDTNEPNNQNERNQRRDTVALASWHKDAPKPVDVTASVAEETGVPGWIAALDTKWYPLEMVASLSVDSGCVTFILNDGTGRIVALADFGTDTAAALAYRVQVARNLSRSQGWAIGE